MRDASTVAISIERPTRKHALHLAQLMFADEERVDMRSVADRLGVGRTTLYRWVGSRDQLLGEVLAQLSDQTWTRVSDRVAKRADCSGVTQALEVIRLFMLETSQWMPLRTFAQREPSTALRVLMSPGSPVVDSLRRGFRRAFEENVDPGDAELDAELLDVMVQLATALEWSPVIINQEPAIERAIGLMRMLWERAALTATRG